MGFWLILYSNKTNSYKILRPLARTNYNKNFDFTNKLV